MKYPFSKKEFLSVQNKLYDEIEKILDENIITNVNFKIEREFLNVPDDNIAKERLYTCNIKEWLYEIKYHKDTIFNELLFCLAYDRINNDFNNFIINKIKFEYKMYYLRLAIYDLSTLMEKIAYLIDELFNRNITLRRNRDGERMVSFNNINSELDKLNIHEKGITWINDDEFEEIKRIMSSFKKDRHIQNVIKVRNNFTHRSNPGIEAIPLMSFEREIVNIEYCKAPDSVKKSICQRNNNDIIQYSCIVRKPIANKFNNQDNIEETIKYEDIISEVLETWKQLINGLLNIVKNTEILKQEIEQ